MMIDRLAGNAALKDSVRLMLGSRRLTHSVLLASLSTPFIKSRTAFEPTSIAA